MTEVSAIFDTMSSDYDDDFTNTELGRYYRERVQQHMQNHWPRDKSILEINAGTGEDAVFLAKLGNQVLATDKSAQMLEIIANKANQNEPVENLSTKQLTIEDLEKLSGHTFDGLLSNFGGLNCVDDLHAFAQDTKSIIKPGGVVILCIMGPYVPWEWFWFIFKGQFKKAFRRVSGKTDWHGNTIYYPSPREIKKLMKDASFTCLEQEALGAFMPPTYARHTFEQRPKVFAVLKWLEKKIARFSLSTYLADHYLLVFQKDSEETFNE